MLPVFLMPETIRREGGFGPEIEVPSGSGMIRVTLGITSIIERESLDIAVWGRSDQPEWGARPLVHFPQKCYCGTYSLPLDLTKEPAVRFLRVEYKLKRWGGEDVTPLFAFYVSADTALKTAAAASA